MMFLLNCNFISNTIKIRRQVSLGILLLSYFHGKIFFRPYFKFVARIEQSRATRADTSESGTITNTARELTRIRPPPRDTVTTASRFVRLSASLSLEYACDRAADM